MKRTIKERHFSDTTGKLHVPCPHRDITGIRIHVVIKDGYCYRSEQCSVFRCKFNSIQSDVKRLLSLIW